MRKTHFIYIYIIILIFELTSELKMSEMSQNPKFLIKNKLENEEFVLKSKDVKNKQFIDDEFTPVFGINNNPSFYWENVPEKTESFAMIVEDPDAPSLFTHWAVINIPAGVKRIEKGKIPNGATEITNSWNIKSYKGPKPPSGQTHRYFFKLYALSQKIEVKDDLDLNTLREKIKEITIKESEIVAEYKSLQLN